MPALLLLAAVCAAAPPPSLVAPVPAPAAPALSVPVTLDIANQPASAVTPALRALYRGSIAEQLDVTADQISGVSFAARGGDGGAGTVLRFSVLPGAGAVAAVASFELGMAVQRLAAAGGATFAKGLRHDISTDAASGGVAPRISFAATPAVATPVPTPAPSPQSEASRLQAQEKRHAFSLEALLRAQLGSVPTPPPSPALVGEEKELAAHLAALRQELQVPSTAAPTTTTAPPPPPPPPTTTTPPTTSAPPSSAGASRAAAPTRTALPPMPVMAAPALAAPAPAVDATGKRIRPALRCALGRFKQSKFDASTTLGYHFSCQACPPGKYGRADGSDGLGGCASCAAGKFVRRVGGLACRACPRGKYGPTAGSYWCAECAAGFYQDFPGYTFCFDRRHPGVLPTPRPTSAPTAAPTPPPSRAPTVPPTPYFLVGTRAPTPHRPPAAARATGDGQRAAGGGAQPCPIGTQTAERRDAGSSLGFRAYCAPCGAGQYGTAVALQPIITYGCRVCPRGKFTGRPKAPHGAAGTAAQLGATSCTACPKGQFAGEAGATQCYACPRGQYSERAGAATCQGFVELSGLGPTRLCGATTPRLQLRRGNATNGGRLKAAAAAAAAEPFSLTPWQLFGSDAVYLDVDTRWCKFAEQVKREAPTTAAAMAARKPGSDPSAVSGVPVYVTAVVGSEAWWALQPATTVLQAEPHRFRVLARLTDEARALLQRRGARGASGAGLLTAARAHWQLSWIGAFGRGAGTTTAGKTGWGTDQLPRWDKKGGKTLYADVNTADCSYENDPLRDPGHAVRVRYLTTLLGDTHGLRLAGQHIVYRPTPRGFRLYVAAGARRIDAELANNYQWRVAWVGLPKRKWVFPIATTHGDDGPSGVSGSKWLSPRADGYPFGDGRPIAPGARDDASDAGFDANPDAGQFGGQRRRLVLALKEPKEPKEEVLGMMVDVSAWRSGFLDTPRRTPTYVAGLQTDARAHWRITGGNAIFRPKASGFRLYLARGEPAYAHRYKFEAVYVGVESEAPCAMAPWGRWAACSLTCGGGTRWRFRSVTQARRSDAGAGCGAALQEQSQACGTAPCAAEACEMSPWGPYSRCSKVCGGGWQHRGRVVTKRAKYGGDAQRCAAQHLKGVRRCALAACPPVDCSLSAWSAWSPCTLTCGGGLQHHNRTVVQQPKYHGRPCGPLRGQRACNVPACAVDCVVASWQPWSECVYLYGAKDGACRVAPSARARNVVTKPAYGGRSCPPTRATRLCAAAAPCVGAGGVAAQKRGAPAPAPGTVGAAQAAAAQAADGHLVSMCGATASPAAAAVGWRPYGTRGIYFAADAVRCGFRVAPQYVATLLIGSGTAATTSVVSSLRGAAAVSAVSREGFTWAASSAFVGAAQLRRTAQLFAWRLGWVGASGPFTGVTRAGHTGWRAGGGSGARILADVDVRQSSYISTPRLFVSLRAVRPHRGRRAASSGALSLMRTHGGAGAVYRSYIGGTSAPLATRTSFRVYVFVDAPGGGGGSGGGGSGGRGALAAAAEAAGWVVSWIGLAPLPRHLDGSAGAAASRIARAMDLPPVARLPTQFAELAGEAAPPRLLWRPKGDGLFQRDVGASVDTTLRGALGAAVAAAAAAGDTDDDTAVDGALASQSGAHPFLIVPTYVAALAVGYEEGDGTAAGTAAALGRRSLHQQAVQCADSAITISAPTNRSFAAYIGLRPASEDAPGAAAAARARARSGSSAAKAGGAALAPAIAGANAQWRVNFIGFGVVDCVVSPWGAWSACDRSCGGGAQVRRKRVLVFPQGGGKPCPPGAGAVGRGQRARGVGWAQQRPCNGGVQCVGQGGSSMCGGMTLAGANGTHWFANRTRWRRYGSRGIYVDVDTSACGFGGARRAKGPRQVPYYAMSVIGDQAFPDDWQLTGTSALSGYPRPARAKSNGGADDDDSDGSGDGAHVNADGFRAIVLHPTVTGPRLLRAATKFAWRVSWVGDTGRNCGRTTVGSTGWVQTGSMSKYTVYADVRVPLATSGFGDPSAYPIPPRFFTSLLGRQGHWATRGAHIVHEPTRHGFRVYLVSMTPLTARDAERNGWALQWIGVGAAARSGSSIAWARNDPKGVGSDSSGLHIDVDTSASKFRHGTPAYVSSVAAYGGYHLLWQCTGAANIYGPTETGFRVYLHQVRFIHRHRRACRTSPRRCSFVARRALTSQPPAFVPMPAPDRGLASGAGQRVAGQLRGVRLRRPAVALGRL